MTSPAEPPPIETPTSRWDTFLGWTGWSIIKGTTAWIGAVGVAVAAFTGLIFTYQQYLLAERGQVTDRFGKAIEHLGSTELDVRLGGIYSLERLSRDSEGDRPTIMEVLSGYVRTHAQAPAPTQPPTVGPATPVRCPPPEKGVPIDIQAVVSVIGRRDPTVVDVHPIDLSYDCLFGVNFAGMQLPGAELRASDLSFADFVGFGGHDYSVRVVDLSNAHLERANLSDTTALGLNLNGAFMYWGDLTRAALCQADLSGARIASGNLTKAKLTGAKLINADLTDAVLSGARLIGADLTSAHLTGTVLDGIVYDRSTKWPTGFTPPPSSPADPYEDQCQV